MKTNKILCILLVLIFSMNFLVVPVMAEEDIKVLLNDTALSFDVRPQIINDRVMVPMRAIFEALDCEVRWDPSILTASATSRDGIKVIFTLWNSTMRIVRGEVLDDRGNIITHGTTERVELYAPPQIVDGRTLVPVRAISEAVDAEVNWDGYIRSVIISQGTELDINDPEVQQLFADTQAGSTFVSFCPGYMCNDLLDTRNVFALGGLAREVISILSMKNIPDVKYTDEQAHEIVTQFLSKCELDEGSRLNSLNSINFKNERLIGLYSRSELDAIATELFGAPLPKTESISFLVSYVIILFGSRTNMLEHYPETLGYIFYYNDVTEEYLITDDLRSPSSWQLDGYLDYYNNSYALLKSSTQLLRATRYNDEISLYVYREAEFGEYSGGIGFYKGEYRNTYKKSGDGYHWVSSYGLDYNGE